MYLAKKQLPRIRLIFPMNFARKNNRESSKFDNTSSKERGRVQKNIRSKRENKQKERRERDEEKYFQSKDQAEFR